MAEGDLCSPVVPLLSLEADLDTLLQSDFSMDVASTSHCLPYDKVTTVTEWKERLISLINSLLFLKENPHSIALLAG